MNDTGGCQHAVTLNFVGPFSWAGTSEAPSLCESEAGKESGIYLWTVRRPEGELVYYVGETGRSFADRMCDHFREHASGGYNLHSPEEFRQGQRVRL